MLIANCQLIPRWDCPLASRDCNFQQESSAARWLYFFLLIGSRCCSLDICMCKVVIFVANVYCKCNKCNFFPILWCHAIRKSSYEFNWDFSLLHFILLSSFTCVTKKSEAFNFPHHLISFISAAHSRLIFFCLITYLITFSGLPAVMSWQLISILPSSSCVVVSSTLKSDENVKSSGAHLTTQHDASLAHPKNCVSSCWEKERRKIMMKNLVNAELSRWGKKHKALMKSVRCGCGRLSVCLWWWKNVSVVRENAESSNCDKNKEKSRCTERNSR